MDFKNKKVVLFAALGLALVIFLLWFLFSGLKTTPGTVPSANDSGGKTGSVTAAPVPAGTVVPGTNSTSTDVAKPTAINKIGAGGAVNQRNYAVEVKNDLVTPQKIAVYVGDVVNIAFTSADKTYDFVQPDNGAEWTVSLGKPITLRFSSPNAGQFTYYCKSCGGPGKGPVGYFVVVPR